MTKDEVIEFLESYAKEKNLEKLKVNTIMELETNANTAKGIKFDSDQVQGGKRVLPEYVYAMIIDLKEELIRNIYSNSIRLKILEKYIHTIASTKNIAYGNILYYKFIWQYRYLDIERETSYSIVRIKQILKESIDIMYDLLADISIDEIEQRIHDESQITRNELDEYYRKLYY